MMTARAHAHHAYALACVNDDPGTDPAPRSLPHDATDPAAILPILARWRWHRTRRAWRRQSPLAHGQAPHLAAFLDSLPELAGAVWDGARKEWQRPAAGGKRSK